MADRAGPRVPVAVLSAALVLVLGCSGDDGPSERSQAPPPSTTPFEWGDPGPAAEDPLPTPVEARSEPEVTLADPAFEALPGARADFGRLGGAVYQIEVPEDWNGRLVLFMHGFEDLRPEAGVSPPQFRRYLITQGLAWGASSFSSTSLIPERSALETAALWDHFAETYGRPAWTYVTGRSMGGAASHIAAERYASRFDGALALCGNAVKAAGSTSGTDWFAAGAFVAGVTQAKFDASTGIPALVQERILPALADPVRHERFEDIVIDLTGGPRAFDREGVHAEEETNWRRAELLVSAGLATNRDRTYRLGPRSDVGSEEFNRAVIRFPTNDELLEEFLEGEETTGRLAIPLLSMHTTGDGQVPIEQARVLQRRVAAAGRGDRLVQRVVRDPGHCGFTYAESVANLEALADWVEHGRRPEGTNVRVEDLRTLDRTFELVPRAGTPEADVVPGAADRAVLRGRVTLDGAPFDATFLGAVVRRDGLVTPCHYGLTDVDGGRYEITVQAEAEATGCGGPGSEVLLWTFARDQMLFSADARRWPGDGGAATFDTTFSPAAPRGGAPATSGRFGELLDEDGRPLAPGTRVEAYVGDVLCAVSSSRRTGSFSGYVLDVVEASSVAGCTRGATLTFRVDGREAPETAVHESADEPLDLTRRR